MHGRVPGTIEGQVELRHLAGIIIFLVPRGDLDEDGPRRLRSEIIPF